MDFPISSSVVLVAAVAFWLLGIAPVLLKRRARVQPVAEAVQEQGETSVTMLQSRTTSSRQKERKEDETVPMDEPEQLPLPGHTRSPRIKTGRAAIALLGAASLVAVPIVALLAVFSVLSFGAPVICLAVTAACVASLRHLAKKDRERRVQRAFEEAMAPVVVRTDDVVPSNPRTSPSEPFDVAPAADEPEEAPLTAQELREAALAVAREIGDAETASASTWEPVEVPKPLYVDAPKAERPAPEPLAMPETPKPEGKSLIKDALKPDLSKALQAGGVKVAMVGSGQSSLRNLDAILQRRRA
ncbi:hypothetical protein [Arthrobacter sp. NPDC090010]|uniref:hypothetical protein n=1 Tax=Arthrobacter sp. NPDC090010 TaxID=3363942 RepID=UPI00381162A1